LTIADKILDAFQLAGEGTLSITHHVVKREGSVWNLKANTDTVFLPKLKAPAQCD
jgi:hypothetical protein